MKISIAALVGAACLAGACAAPPPPEAKPPAPAVRLPGWIEFVVADTQIPADPLAAADGPSPPTCEIEVLLGAESVLSLTLEPRGAAPPYTLDAQFTIRAAPGRYTAVVHYASCRNHEGRPDTREASIPLTVDAGHITLTRFDGSTLTARTPTLPTAP